jgi:hypothetical protein
MRGFSAKCLEKSRTPCATITISPAAAAAAPRVASPVAAALHRTLLAAVVAAMTGQKPITGPNLESERLKTGSNFDFWQLHPAVRASAAGGTGSKNFGCILTTIPLSFLLFGEALFLDMWPAILKINQKLVWYFGIRA